ncbi:MAG: EF-P lysine aminoacylase GenX [Methylococcales bacterium]|nr:MAG: EF-P lysine aminoacylase GenX [Methylococcales bacterium]
MIDDWRPTCAIDILRLRAQVFNGIRCFFLAKDVLEVETPLLGHACGTDPQLDFFTTDYIAHSQRDTLFLQTSPEFAMKRLLAAGSGSIYQICKAFRNGESGRFHNPEFTMLEWYRVGFTLTELMDEISELIETLSLGYLSLNATQRFTYQDVFQRTTGLNSLTFSYVDYSAFALANGQPEALAICGYEHALWLDFIFSHYIQPHLGENAVCMVYGYPACQSSLARINPLNPLITDRIEVFINGIELGNGYYELTDAQEQNKRFDEEIAVRLQNNRPVTVKDKQLIAAMEQGLPECSGMAIGLDRLIMALTGNLSINDVLSFPVHRA